MRLYEFKRGHKKTIDDVEKIMREVFGEVRREGERLISSYKGLERIEIWFHKGKMAAETASKKVSNEDAMDTLKKWNEFLYRVTGYTAKERKKKMTKS